MTEQQARRMWDRMGDEGASAGEIQGAIMQRFIRENFDEARHPLPQGHWMRRLYREIAEERAKSLVIKGMEP